ncbi:hypothetical protein [Bradyrhizobium sp.]|uniref:hypothetical protein n=1 Tax=Bradyrhizobium sp. TaxID=376 RepID=UPI0027186357|nr:hypothetical protein [Bradyrhizobium sp.]MDO9295814.1 hypothetical protein [Bradyrhizobium sp.]
MNRQVNPNGHAPRAQDIKGGLRHPDGSFDIAAYAKLAHRERAAAIAASAREAVRMVREMGSAVRARLAPASGKHHAHIAR